MVNPTASSTNLHLNIDRHYSFSFFDLVGHQNFSVVPDTTSFIINSVNFSFNYAVTNNTSNTISITFYNLSQNSISLFTGKNNRRGFIFNAWYGDNTSPDNTGGSTTIFRGLTFTVNTYRQGADVITEVIGCDVFLNLMVKGIQTQPFPPGTTYLAVIKYMLNYYGGIVSLNPSSEQFLTGTYRSPQTFVGQFETILKKITADAGLTYSLQNGIITMVPSDFVLPTAGNIQYIDRTNGLVGYVRAISLSTQLFAVNYFKTVNLNQNFSLISVTTLLRHYDLYSTVYLQSEFFNGYYNILGLTQNGEWRGNTWYSTLKLWPNASKK